MRRSGVLSLDCPPFVGVFRLSRLGLREERSGDIAEMLDITPCEISYRESIDRLAVADLLEAMLVNDRARKALGGPF